MDRIARIRLTCHGAVVLDQTSEDHVEYDECRIVTEILENGTVVETFYTEVENGS